MVDSLDDPYSTYMNQEETEKFDESISSSFEGIGAQVEEQNGQIMVVSPIKGSPAEEAGLKSRDVILEVDGESIEGMSVSEAVLIIRGEKGTEVELLIDRDGVGELTIPIIRDTIPIETVYSEILNNNIGKVQITQFSAKTASELIEVLKEFDEKEVKGIVVDVRQNPGGLLDRAVTISNLFVDKGETILKVENRNGSVETILAENEKMIDVPVVLMIDGGSASASEILAGALNGSANIPLVGEKTFGKGTVQTEQKFDDGSALKLTTAKWLTASGEWIHEKGIEPQHQVSLPDYASLPYIDPDESYKQGDSSPEVKVVEEIMTALDETDANVDGFFDNELYKDIQEFQQENGLKRTGVVTGETTKKLIEQVSQLIKDNDTQLQKAIEVLEEQM
ncbi:S41 family peptidase [Bacillus carboniphilus]|uniref:S41 family peptidase n=1 Tax=Bacillus carboniphilus TaxID=86663 RepID=A0ABY9JYB7_9BACI|nr:S41 family peptidase [Bacillus carboniphilus]WLR43338.1 S41 family peptidase [Bacillus carboniphilus]